MKRLAFSTLLSFLLVGTALCAQEVKIGLITPLTGPRASIGQDASQGAELALEHLKANHSPSMIDVVIEDSQGDPAKGVSAYKKLLADGVKFMLTQNSNVSLAIAPMVNHDGVIQLAITTTSERYSTPNDNTFRVNGSTKPEADLIISTVVERAFKGTKVALVTMQDEYPVTLSKYVRAGFSERKIDLFAQEFLASDLDFRTIISKIATAKVGAVVFLGYQSQAGIFVKQFRELGSPSAIVLCTTPVNNREFFEIAGTASDGVFLTYPSISKDHPAARAFELKFGRHPNFFSANSYDAVIIADRTLKACGYNLDQQCLRNSLFTIKDFNGLSGAKQFDSINGDAQDRYELLIARKGAFVGLN